jgi:hypothetical protein
MAQSGGGRISGSIARAVTIVSGNWQNYWLICRFYMSMLAVAAIDFCFAVIYEIPFSRFLPTALLLILFTLVGAHVIFRPIRHYLLDRGARVAPIRRIATLGFVCTAYMAAVISFCRGCWISISSLSSLATNACGCPFFTRCTTSLSPTS